MGAEAPGAPRRPASCPDDGGSGSQADRSTDRKVARPRTPRRCRRSAPPAATGRRWCRRKAGRAGPRGSWTSIITPPSSRGHRPLRSRRRPCFVLKMAVSTKVLHVNEALAFSIAPANTNQLRSSADRNPQSARGGCRATSPSHPRRRPGRDAGRPAYRVAGARSDRSRRRGTSSRTRSGRRATASALSPRAAPRPGPSVGSGSGTADRRGRGWRNG